MKMTQGQTNNIKSWFNGRIKFTDNKILAQAIAKIRDTVVENLP